KTCSAASFARLNAPSPQGGGTCTQESVPLATHFESRGVAWAHVDASAAMAPHNREFLPRRGVRELRDVLACSRRTTPRGDCAVVAHRGRMQTPKFSPRVTSRPPILPVKKSRAPECRSAVGRILREFALEAAAVEAEAAGGFGDV